MKIDFYQIEMPNDEYTFDDLLNEIFEDIPDDESRTFEVSKQQIRMQVLSSGSRYWEGEFMAVINGNASGNILNGTLQNDLIRGFGGDDTLNGSGGERRKRAGVGA